MLKEYLVWLKNNVTDELFDEIVIAATTDVEFNMLRFGKEVSEEYFVDTLKICYLTFQRI